MMAHASPALACFLALSAAVVAAEPGVADLRAAGKGSCRLVVLVAAVVATVMGATVAARGPWEDYTFTASSAAAGFRSEGRLGDIGPYDLIVHTNVETAPWLEIDLLRERTVERLVVVSGAGCCRHRSLPLVFELAGEDRSFVEVARRETRVGTWDERIPPRRARYARIRALATTVLHFQAIEIR